MRTKIFTLFLALVASVGSMLADKVQIGELYYNLDDTSLTAEVTYGGAYSGEIVIPSLVTYENVTYSVTRIGDFAFSNYANITSITIPNSVTSLGSHVFYNCRDLKSVICESQIPINIESSTFEKCNDLSSIYVPCGTLNAYEQSWSRYAGIIKYHPLKYTIVGNVNIAAAGIVTIPSTICDDTIITAAPNYGYYFIQWSDGINENPRAIDLTKDTTFTAEFDTARTGVCGNEKLLTWTYEPSTKTLTISGSGALNENYTYGIEAPTQMQKLVIENGVTSIGDYAFYNCSGLKSVIIPNSVTSIGSGAFMACEALISLSILNPDVQYNSTGSMFQNCPQLKKIIAPACIFDASDEDVNRRQAYLAHNLDSIVVTGGQLTDNAIWFITLSRKTLKSIDLSATTHTSLTDEVFNEFYNLTSLKLPANLTHVGYKMVAECVKLKSIDIPASVTEIDDRAFEDCRSIETITFGGIQPTSVAGIKRSSSASQLHRIGSWAFYNAHELQHLDVPEGVTEIGDGAFYGCTYLEDLVLPTSVQSIGDNCFALCSKMMKIVVNSTTPPTIATKTFYDVKRQIPVYVPDNCVDAYKEDALWGEFNIIGQSQAPTAIEQITNDQSQMTTKIFRNGQIFILRGDKTFTVTGQEVR